MQKSILKKIFLILCFILIAAAGSEKHVWAEEENNASTEEKWIIYIYMCGTDLESNFQSATQDIVELMEEQLPPHTYVAIQAGGTNDWQNVAFKSNKINRYVYSANGLNEIETLPNADMGSKDTLEDFLRFTQLDSAQHKMIIFWDHGGGTLGGVCYDERTNNSLSLNEIRQAFNDVYGLNPEQPPFDIIGFDACLMATYSTANTLDGISRYMLASEEIEPGCGWQYTHIAKALANNPDIAPEELGKIICDSYKIGCDDIDDGDKITLSLIDINKMAPLRQAYEDYGKEIFSKLGKNNFTATYSRNAYNSENYGGNTQRQGYMDLIDIGDMTKNSLDILPQSSPNLLKALDEAVIYKVNGPYRKNSCGLSAFFPLSGSKDNVKIYNTVLTASDAHKAVYNKLLSLNYANAAKLEDWPIRRTKNNSASVKIPKELLDEISEVRLMLCYFDIEEDIMLVLGEDTNIKANWEKGRFVDRFDGTWPALDGHYLYIEVVETTDDYTLYSSPIKLNGNDCNLQFVYDYDEQCYRILGTTKDIVNNIAAKDIVKLKPGDKITNYAAYTSLSEDDSDVDLVEIDTFTYKKSSEISDEDMGDGTFAYAFEFITPTNESYTSEIAYFDVSGDDISLILDEDLEDD